MDTIESVPRSSAEHTVDPNDLNLTLEQLHNKWQIGRKTPSLRSPLERREIRRKGLGKSCEDVTISRKIATMMENGTFAYKTRIDSILHKVNANYLAEDDRFKRVYSTLQDVQNSDHANTYAASRDDFKIVKTNLANTAQGLTLAEVSVLDEIESIIAARDLTQDYLVEGSEHSIYNTKLRCWEKAAIDRLPHEYLLLPRHRLNDAFRTRNSIPDVIDTLRLVNHNLSQQGADVSEAVDLITKRFEDIHYQDLSNTAYFIGDNIQSTMAGDTLLSNDTEAGLRVDQAESTDSNRVYDDREYVAAMGKIVSALDRHISVLSQAVLKPKRNADFHVRAATRLEDKIAFDSPEVQKALTYITDVSTKSCKIAELGGLENFRDYIACVDEIQQILFNVPYNPLDADSQLKAVRTSDIPSLSGYGPKYHISDDSSDYLEK